MRFIIILVALVGCATIHRPEGEKPPVVTYFGTAKGATAIIDAQRSFDLADTAMDKGLPVSLQKTDEFVGFSSNTYGYTSGLYGYAPADVVSTTNGWYTGTGQGSSLPRLGTTVVASVTDTSGKIVPCPTGRPSANVAEQAACARADVKLVMAQAK